MNDKYYMISKINSTNSKLESIRNNIKNNYMEKIRDSWNDSICEEYVKAVENIDKIISNIKSNLNECKDYWNSYKEDPTNEEG